MIVYAFGMLNFLISNRLFYESLCDSFNKASYVNTSPGETF